MSEYVIVTRHDEVARSLRGQAEELADAERIEHVTYADQIHGKVVVGVLPHHLRPLCERFIHYSDVSRRCGERRGPIPEGKL